MLKFLSSSHPLIGHFREALERNGEFHGFIPLSVIGACDLKIVNWCKSIHPGAESDPLIMLSLITKAARLHPICIPDDELWIRNKKTYSQKTIQTLANQYPRSAESVQLEAVLIPFMDEKPIEILTLNISPNHYYLDEIGSKLNLKDSSRVLISRCVGKKYLLIFLYMTTRRTIMYLSFLFSICYVNYLDSFADIDFFIIISDPLAKSLLICDYTFLLLKYLHFLWIHH